MPWRRERTMNVYGYLQKRGKQQLSSVKKLSVLLALMDFRIIIFICVWLIINCVMYIVIQEFDDHHELLCHELILENQAAALERVLMAGARPLGGKGKVLDPYGNFWMIKAKDKLMLRIWKIMKRISMLLLNMLRSFCTFIGALVLSVAAVVAFLFLFKRELVNNFITYLVDKYGEKIVNSGLGWVLSHIVEWIKCKADRLCALFLALFRFFRN